MKKIIVGSRDSVLAVMQTELVIAQIKKYNPTIDIELKTFKTTGDKILDKTLDKIGGKGLFVKELDQALYDGAIDLAVHSLKDVPMEENEALPIVAVARRGDPRDVLVMAEGKEERKGDLNGLVIGSSSARRRIQIKEMYPNVTVKNIRGNIQTRLRKLDEGEYDGIILAAAGLKRANLEGRISRTFSAEELLPAAGQGILAIQARKGFDCSFLEPVCDADTLAASRAERGFVTALEGGCSSPVAAYATVDGDSVFLTGLYYDEATGEYYKESTSGSRTKARVLGEEFAAYMKDKYSK